MMSAEASTTYSVALARLTEKLASAGIDSPRRCAEWIVCEVARISTIELIAHPARGLSSDEWDRCLQMAKRRANREPIQYILGFTHFYGLRIRVNPDVLIPRPETEQLVEEVLRRLEDINNPRLLDVGTGSGCIVAAVGRSRPDSRLFACDSEPAALRVAGQNMIELGVQVCLFQSDMLSPGFAAALTGVLDVVVSNPPYVGGEEISTLEPEVRDYEPWTALIAAPDPLIYYRALASEARRVLRPGGQLVVECHEERTAEVATIFAIHGFVDVREQVDLAGRPRIVGGRLPRISKETGQDADIH